MNCLQQDLLSSNKKILFPIQFIKFMAFLSIFLWHSYSWVKGYYRNAPLASAEAVSLFFMLSGLGTGYMAYGTTICTSFTSIFRFVGHKIKKFYPLYFITTFFAVMLSGVPMLIAKHNSQALSEHLVQLFKNLLLLQSWFTTKYFSFNGVGWFLSTMMFLYLLTPFLLKLVVSCSKYIKKNWQWVLSFVVVAFLIVTYCYVTKNYKQEYWHYTFPIARIGEYFIGIVLGYLLSDMRCFVNKKWGGRNLIVLFTFAEIVSLIVWFGFVHIHKVWWQWRIVHWILPNFLLLLVFGLGFGYISKVFSGKIFVFLGNISFECFLIHPLILSVYRKFNVGIQGDVGNLFSVVFCLLLTIILALSYHGCLRK